MTRVLFLFALLLCLIVPARAQESGGGGGYTVGGIRVDIAAKSAQQARNAAFREAQRRAWPLLWTQLTGLAPGSAPRLGDGGLDGIVSGIEIQSERFSTTRYIATLAVVFDRQRASDYLGGTAGALRSGPMLLLPLIQVGGVRTIYQTKTPWVEAWLRFREGISPMDYVLASGSAGDNVLLTAYQVRRSDRRLWRNILNRFETIDVLTAEVKLDIAWPGGPIEALFIARHGPDANELGRFSMSADSEAGLAALLDAGAARIDAIYAQALRTGRLRSEVDLSEDLAPILSAAPLIGGEMGAIAAAAGAVEAAVVTPDEASLLAAEAQLRATPTVAGVTVVSTSIGGTSRLVIRHADTREMLLYQLDQRGLRLAPSEGGLLLRRREPGDVPIPAPIVAPPADGSTPVPAEPGDAPAPAAPPTTTPPAAPIPSPGPTAPPASASPPERSRRTPTAPPPAAPPPDAAPAPVDLLPPGAG